MGTPILKRQTSCRPQNTIRNTVFFSGIGIHTGKAVSVRFCPAKEGTGINFKRIDLPGQPIIPASLEYVCDTSRSTTIGTADIRIHTVEHLLAAVRAFEVDNLYVEISSIEPPVGDGSSNIFVKMLEEAEVVPQKKPITLIKLMEPVYWSDKDIHIVALPDDHYRISYTLNYPNSKILNCQYHSVTVNRDNFVEQIAPCRTFSQYEEVSALMDRGLIKGGSLDNAVIIKDNAILSKDGLRFSNEMARHKILDMIGDLALTGFHFICHIISIRSGHKSNLEFAEKLFKIYKTENC